MERTGARTEVVTRRSERAGRSSPWRCPHCGESYYTAATLEEIDRIQKHRREITVAKRVPVAKFKGAA